jgi:hypothetical protein
MSASYFCHVCGFLLGPDAPWGDDGLNPTFAICDCCGVEFGYEDTLMKGVKRYREQWLFSGAVWVNPKAKPSNWSLDQQLKQIPERLPVGIKNA